MLLSIRSFSKTSLRTGGAAAFSLPGPVYDGSEARLIGRTLEEEEMQPWQAN